MLSPIIRAAGTARMIGLSIFLLIACAAAAVIAFATRAGLTARREIVELLHLAGAEDRFIAALFQNRFGRLAASAGLFGAAAAVIIGALMRLAGGGEGLTPVFPIAWIDLLALAACPVLAGLTAATAARLTAARLLRELP
jgi:cell division transport system permease protein